MKKLLVISLLLFSLQVQAAFLPPIDYQDISGTISQTLNESLQFTNIGFNSIMVYVDVPTGGAVTFQMSSDGSTWESISLRSANYDTFGSRFTDDGFYLGSISSAPYIRFLTSTGGSEDGSIDGVLNKRVYMLEGVEFGNPPHRFGFPPIHKNGSYSTQQASTALWTPASGKTIVVTDMIIIVGGSTDGEVKIFDNTDAAGNYLFKGSLEVATNKNAIITHAFSTPFVASAEDNVIKVTTSAAMTIDVMLHGYEF